MFLEFFILLKITNAYIFLYIFWTINKSEENSAVKIITHIVFVAEIEQFNTLKLKKKIETIL